MMAEASAKLTGRPGVCFVTRGPGATNAASGIHVAAQDSTPVVLLIGQVSRDTLCREAFQEIDYTHFYTTTCQRCGCDSTIDTSTDHQCVEGGIF